LFICSFLCSETFAVWTTSNTSKIKENPKMFLSRSKKNCALYAFSMTTVAPSGTCLKTVGSPEIMPTGLTALAGRISLPRLAGVWPKKMQNAVPGGQYASSPSETISFASSDSPSLTGIEKYISSPHVLPRCLIGSAFHIFSAVCESFNTASALMSPAVILIFFSISPTFRSGFSVPFYFK